jgi:hypothetical protein
LRELSNPYLFFKSVMMTLDDLPKRNVKFTEAAFETYGAILAALASYVLRDRESGKNAMLSYVSGCGAVGNAVGGVP